MAETILFKHNYHNFKLSMVARLGLIDISLFYSCGTKIWLVEREEERRLMLSFLLPSAFLLQNKPTETWSHSFSFLYSTSSIITATAVVYPFIQFFRRRKITFPIPTQLFYFIFICSSPNFLLNTLDKQSCYISCRTPMFIAKAIATNKLIIWTESTNESISKSVAVIL